MKETDSVMFLEAQRWAWNFGQKAEEEQWAMWIHVHETGLKFWAWNEKPKARRV
jgi:hypothetical protein